MAVSVKLCGMSNFRRLRRMVVYWSAVIFVVTMFSIVITLVTVDPGASPDSLPQLIESPDHGVGRTKKDTIFTMFTKKTNTSQTLHPAKILHPAKTLHPAKCVRRPDQVRPLVYDVWYPYLLAPSHDEVYIYSALMDDRPQNPKLQLRLMVIARPITADTYCQLWYEDEEEPVVSKLVISKNGRGHKIFGVHYAQYYFTCTVTKPRPVMVSVTSQPCETPQSLVPITYPRRGIEHEFAICVPITFGTVDPYRLIEWAELNRILGVTEINIYYVHMDEKALKPFRYYEQQGFMKLFNIPTVPKYQANYDGNKLNSMISLNDCMYRNMYRYKWIVGVDFDEVILPNSIQDYRSLLQTIDKNSTKKYAGVKSYTFRNAYFWIGCGGELQTPKNSIMMRHVRREPANGHLFAPKSILSPMTCISLFNHYCYHRFPVKNKPFTVDVSPAIATSHHYRKIKSHKNCDALKSKGIEDRSLLQWKPKLEERFNAVIKDMKL